MKDVQHQFTIADRTVTLTEMPTEQALVIDCDLPQTPAGGPRVWVQRVGDTGWKILVHPADGDPVATVITEDGTGRVHAEIDESVGQLSLRCDSCDALYDEGGDGYDGKCPSCADEDDEEE